MDEPQEIKDVSLDALSANTRRELSRMLNSKCETFSGDGRLMDYRGLAELYDKDFLFIDQLDDKRNPTQELLLSLRGTQKDRLSTLWRHLALLGRTDILHKCKDLMRRDAADYQRKGKVSAYGSKVSETRRRVKDVLSNGPTSNCEEGRQNDSKQAVVSNQQENSSVVTHRLEGSKESPRTTDRASNNNTIVDAVHSRTTSGHPNQAAISATSPFPILSYEDSENGPAMYDVFLNYATEDLTQALDLMKELKEKKIRAFVYDVHLALGGSTFEDMAQVIESRCIGRKVVIILTNNYNNCQACQFITNFIRSLGTVRTQKQIIPVLYEELTDIPRILQGMAMIWKTKRWFMDRLVKAIRS